MTLILKLDLDIVMTYFCTQNEVNRPIGSKVITWKQRQTHRQTCVNIYLPALAGGKYCTETFWRQKITLVGKIPPYFQCMLTR